MPNFLYLCEVCESESFHNFRFEDRPKEVECSCGGRAEYRISMPNVVGKASFLDGHKRKGWSELRDAAALNKEKAVAKGDSRKSLEKEIRKLGVKVE